MAVLNRQAVYCVAGTLRNYHKGINFTYELAELNWFSCGYLYLGCRIATNNQGMENQEGGGCIPCHVRRAIAGRCTLGGIWDPPQRLAHYRHQWVVTFLKRHYVIPHGKI